MDSMIEDHFLLTEINLFRGGLFNLLGLYGTLLRSFEKKLVPEQYLNKARLHRDELEKLREEAREHNPDDENFYRKTRKNFEKTSLAFNNDVDEIIATNNFVDDDINRIFQQIKSLTSAINYLPR